MFDALLRAGRLRPPEIDDLRFFGVAGALVPSDDSAAPCTADGVRRGWEEVVAAARRLRRAGIAAWAALGVHPARIPPRGLEAVLAELPDALGRPEVAALGLVGLAEGGEHEERVLARQLELARELRRPVLAGTAWRRREPATRRLLSLLRESEVEPGRVLVAGADARTVRAIRACGHLAALPLSGDGRRSAMDAAVRIVRSLGAEGIVLGSDAGQSGGDLLALPRAADRLEKAGLSDAVVRRVCGENAVAFLGVDVEGVGRGPRPRPRP
ncbi:MAG TPA: TatD family hydrolase [Anaeromyxobacter sp.]|nr:TatD family hydrolase [Anaeromyxobacter sp.]